MIGAIIGWIVVGVISATFFITFWDDIKRWLNNSAADVVEKYLGYDARQFMFKAVSKIDKVLGKIRNRTVVYTKKNRLDNFYSKVTLEADAEPYEIDSRVLQEIEKETVLVQDFEYKGW